MMVKGRSCNVTCLNRNARLKVTVGLLPILAALILVQTFYSQGTSRSAGAVYTMTNADSGNEVLVFDRAADGTLTPAGSYPTGGLGSGGGLGNQGGLILSHNERYLFAVNAGSNEISVFRVRADCLQLVQTVPSNGVLPVSLTLHRRILYVLNAGSDSITGFLQLPWTGHLVAIPGSTRPLSGVLTDPAQIQFSTQRDWLVVTEKATNLIDTFPVNRWGIAGPVNPQPSSGMTPFGFAFGKREQLFVSEAFGGTPGESALSSYTLQDDGSLELISASVGSGETAACWVVITQGGRYAFVSNTGSASISSYEIAFDGTLILLDPQAATTGLAPIDMALSNNSHFLYVLNSGSGTVGDYRIERDGSLTSLPGVIDGLPSSANGLAAR